MFTGLRDKDEIYCKMTNTNFPGITLETNPVSKTKESETGQNLTIVTTLRDFDNEYDGQVTLREAIKYANENGLTTIKFAPELNGIITLDGRQLDIDKNITIDANGANITISGNTNDDKRSRVFNIASGSTVTLVGLTVTNGLASDGGGIYNEGLLTIIDCTIIRNRANNAGGGIDNRSGTVTVISSEITGNSAVGGGGIHNFNGSTLEIMNSIIAGNSADYGGGIHSNSNSSVSTTNSTIAGNNAARGPIDDVFAGKVQRPIAVCV